MPRKLRVPYPGAMYHVMGRGGQRELAGHVLSGRYQAQLVEGSGNGYLRAACGYGHFRLNWTSEDLLRRPKSDPRKLALAARLRRETTLSIEQIAGRLNLGKPKSAKSNLHKWMNRPPDDGSQPRLDI